MSFSVSLRNISKMYRIYEKPQAKLKEAILRSILRTNRAFHKEFWALRDINLDIKRGECLGIIGQNGSGKSTLLQIIAGILQPTTGTVLVDGKISALLELGAGFNSEFTGRENIFMNGAILGISKGKMEERFDDIAAFADIGEFIDQPVKTYSSGMFVRLAFATAINVDPEILIIDEALAVGDIMFRNRCYRKIEEIREAQNTIIFVSHDMMALQIFCDRACLMDKGKIIDVGKTDAIITAYNKLMAERQDEYHNRIRGISVHPPDERFVSYNNSKKGMEFRYGTGDVEIVDYQLLDHNHHPTTIIEIGKPFSIVFNSLFRKKCSDPVIGITIKSIYGIRIFGVNTLMLDIPIEPVSEKEIILSEFKVHNNLNLGEYKFSVGVWEKTDVGFKTMDRLEDVGLFKVVGKIKAHGLVTMDSVVKISRRKGKLENYV